MTRYMIIHNKHFDTNPFIFHHHGKAKYSNHPMGLPLKKQFFDSISMQSSVCDTFVGRKERITYPIPPKSTKIHDINNQLTIFTVSNLQYPGSAMLCLDFYGIKYSIIGQDITVFDGQRKLEQIISFIPTIKTKYVMLLDSDDIFITCDKFDDLLNNYERIYNCTMLFQAEGWNFPRGNIEMDLFEKSVCDESIPYKHLNSGIWISTTQFMHEICQDLIDTKQRVYGDQPAFKEVYRKYHPRIKIDNRCNYFQSLAWNSWFEERYAGMLNLDIIS